MSVTLSGSLISFPPLSVERFTPVHNLLNIFRDGCGNYGFGYYIEEITTIIDGEVKVAGILIDENATEQFINHVFIDVTRVMRFKVKKL
jgi:hypothetical protein